MKAIQYCLASLTLLLNYGNNFAQNVDYNKIVVPDRVANVSFEERLVQLAWKNQPSNKVLQTDVEIAESHVKQSQWSWLDRISATGNVNEFTLNPDDFERSEFYPRYNFSIRLDLGMFANIPQEVKRARLSQMSREYLVNEQKIEIRKQVLLGLQRLEEMFRLIKLAERMKEDNYVMFKDAEEKFSLGDITIERYRASLQSYSLRMADLIQARSDFNQEKITMEALIGVPMEEVEGYEQFLVDLAKKAQAEF